MTDAPRPLSWNYAGLANMIYRKSEIANEESAFLLSMAIDLQVGTINAGTASFFTGQPSAPPKPATL